MPFDRNTVSPDLTFTRLWQAIAWLGVVAVITLSLTPKPPQVPGVFAWDKGQHVIAYATLMWWFRQVFAPRRSWVVFLVMLGVALEYIQGWTGYRYFAYGDMAANTLGVGCGVMLVSTSLGRTVTRIDRVFSRILRRSG